MALPDFIKTYEQAKNYMPLLVDDFDDPVFRAKVNIAIAKWKKQLAESSHDNSNT